jgi:hypothetical protein
MDSRRLLRSCLFVLLVVTLLTPASGASASAVHPAAAAVDQALPRFVPDSIFLGNGEIVYLVSKQDKLIYRWDVAAMQYLDPITMTSTPSYISYSAGTNRIYLAYPTNAITQIRLDDSLVEQSFYQLTNQVCGLAAAGEYIWANENMFSGGSSATCSSGGHNISILSPDGVRLGGTNAEYSESYVWNGAKRRLYYLHGDTNDNRWVFLSSKGIDTSGNATGFVGMVTTQYNFKQPTLVKSDGSILIFGSGAVHDGETLTFKSTIPVALVDGVWLGDDFVGLVANTAQTVLKRWDASYTVQKTASVRGAPLGLFATSGGLLVVSNLSGSPQFTTVDANLEMVGEGPWRYHANLPVLFTRIFVIPGNYPVNRCAAVEISSYPDGTDLGKMTECVTSVQVGSDGKMRFNYSWKLDIKQGITECIRKHDDYQNPKMYITDNAGTTHAMIGAGGAAFGIDCMVSGKRYDGWFLFPGAVSTNTTFTFHDDDQKLLLGPIALPAIY